MMMAQPALFQSLTDNIFSAAWWQELINDFGALGIIILKIALIIVGAMVVAFLAKLFIRGAVRRVVKRAQATNRTLGEARNDSPLDAVRLVARTRTIGSIFQNAANIAVVIISMVMIVNVVAPSMLTSFSLITAAVGAGLGFGAQNIVKDVLNGMFIVAEDQIGIGDVVDLGLATGVVEYVAVRVTHVRDANGTLWFVRNGEIIRIGNLSQGWSRVIVDVGVPQDIPIEQLEKTLREAASSLSEQANWREALLSDPEIWGLESITGSTMLMRVVVKTTPAARDEVAQELRTRLYLAAAAKGITLPSLESVHLVGFEAGERVTARNLIASKSTSPRPSWRPHPETKQLPNTDTTEQSNGSSND